jgi:hypothetical protein
MALQREIAAYIQYRMRKVMTSQGPQGPLVRPYNWALQRIMHIERRKEPIKKASWGLVKDFLKWVGWRDARVVMQRQRKRKRKRLKMKTVTPIVLSPEVGVKPVHFDKGHKIPYREIYAVCWPELLLGLLYS